MKDDDAVRSYQFLRDKLDRFDQWSLDSQNFQRTSYSRRELALRLRGVLLTVDLDDEAFDLLMAMSCALEGRHRGFRLQLDRPLEGSTFKAIKRHETWQQTFKMADEIDTAMADGQGSDSAVVEAMQRYGLSRTEVFNRLKEVRGARARSFAACEARKRPQQEGRDCPWGYAITKDGKLVRKGA